MTFSGAGSYHIRATKTFEGHWEITDQRVFKTPPVDKVGDEVEYVFSSTFHQVYDEQDYHLKRNELHRAAIDFLDVARGLYTHDSEDLVEEEWRVFPDALDEHFGSAVTICQWLAPRTDVRLAVIEFTDGQTHVVEMGLTKDKIDDKLVEDFVGLVYEMADHYAHHLFCHRLTCQAQIADEFCEGAFV